MRPLVHWLTAAVCCSVCATAGCGSNSSVSAGTPAPITPAPVTTTAKAKFAYTGNQGASLSGYSVDNSTGALMMTPSGPCCRPEVA